MAARPILVVDDEPNMRTALFEALTRQGHAVDLAENGEEALDKFKANPFDLVITDVRMPRVDGLEVLREIKKSSAQTPVVVVSGYGTVESAVEAMREGAFDYIMKPFSLDLIEQTVSRALQSANRHAKNRDKQTPPRGRKTHRDRGPGHEASFENDRQRGPLPRPPFCSRGSPGPARSFLARYIHAHSERAGGPFVAVNCASLPEGLLESELFGHEKGSFTGAIAKKSGKFELANGGTILLDEISEMDLSLQAKLLRVLQEGEVDRVGGKAPTKIDVRVIATTNRNLKEWVEQGSFRQDLYYRLNVIPLTIPPLRDRPVDIPLLAAFFLEKYAAQNNKSHKTLSCRGPWSG